MQTTRESFYSAPCCRKSLTTLSFVACAALSPRGALKRFFMQGWISVHRSLLTWEWYDDNNTKSLFLHCLLKANHAPREWRGISIDRGQFYTSLESLCSELGLSPRNLRTSFDKLKSTGEVTSSGMARGRMITVHNYYKYQSTDKLSVTQATGFRQGSDRLPTTTNNTNNKNNEITKEKDVIQWAEIQNKFNEILGDDLGKIRGFSDARKKHVKARINEEPEKRSSVEWWGKYFEYISQSDFLTGKGALHHETGRPFAASFDWIINPNNMLKVLEGKYNGK